MKVLLAIPVIPLWVACSFNPTKSTGDDGGTGSDGGSDSGPDGKVFLDARLTDAGDLCFGADPYLVCLPVMPSASVVFDAETIDTDESQCRGTTHTGTVIDLMNGGRKLCVFAGTTVDVNGRLRAEGDLPLVLVSSGDINLNGAGYVDVSSYRSNPTPGAAADDGNCIATNGASEGGGGGGGGGAGGSFGGTGGTGAPGATGATGGTTSVPGAPTFLRGGCRGSEGGSSGNGGGSGGASGGALYLLAKVDLKLSGKIDASGAGGLGGPDKGGGGGGGSGGMIVLYAGTNIVFNGTARVWANGGGGGGGGTSNTAGIPGEQSTEPTVRAVGGAGGGGEGSSGVLTGEAGALVSGKGGGAGGGGAGVIVNVSGQTLTSNQISPAPRGP
jgi:hypothetical protein